MKVLGPDCSPKVPSKDPQPSGCSNSQLSCHFLMATNFLTSSPPKPSFPLPQLAFILHAPRQWDLACSFAQVAGQGWTSSEYHVDHRSCLSDTREIVVVSDRKLCRGPLHPSQPPEGPGAARTLLRH